ncbi:MAG TPA: CHAT domain-containing protein, partial [Polyangium sp.]|nr:CHAT domain-containing protein [Polyangium sp.]
MAWLEIELERTGDNVRVSARGSRGERPTPHTFALAQGIETLTTLASKVGRAVRTGRELDPTAIELAQTIYAEIFAGELRE